MSAASMVALRARRRAAKVCINCGTAEHLVSPQRSDGRSLHCLPCLQQRAVRDRRRPAGWWRPHVAAWYARPGAHEHHRFQGRAYYTKLRMQQLGRA